MDQIKTTFTASFIAVWQTVKSVARSSVRSLAIASLCALFIFAAATPAMAFGGDSSKPSKGLEQLNGIQQKSEKAAASGPKSGANGTRSVSKDAEEGLNGVQGDANQSNMKRPANANGNTIEGNIEEALEEVTP